MRIPSAQIRSKTSAASSTVRAKIEGQSKPRAFGTIPCKDTAPIVGYETVDVLQDPEIRQGIKAYSEWPTIPQLYVKGEFVGGSDIMMEMFESGELKQLLGAEA